MDKKELLELYAKMYNTLMEMAWTLEDEDLSDDIKQDIIRVTDAIYNCIFKSDDFLEEDKDYFTLITDHIRDRIYFNI